MHRDRDRRSVLARAPPLRFSGGQTGAMPITMLAAIRCPAVLLLRRLPAAPFGRRLPQPEADVLATLFHPTSYLGIVVFLVLTGCGLPIPEEVAIVVAGVLSAQGHLQPELALAACLAGAIIGDCLMYAIGYRWGHSLLSVHPRLAKFLRADREARFEQAIERHAFKVMLLSRFLVGIRGPVYLAAGVVRMPFRRFLLFDILCATLVVVFFFLLSYAFGEEVIAWIRHAELTVTVVVLLVVAAVATYLYRRSRRQLTEAVIGQSDSGKN
jgi:membrane protein DedA with SNARE-associated domain